MTPFNQVNTFQRIVLLSSSELDSPNVTFIAMLDPVKRHSSPPKHQQLLPRQHSVASHKTGSFIHAAMQTSNFASHLALTSCYQYYVRINMIIWSILTWYCFNTLRTGLFKLFKHLFPGFFTILTL